MFTRKNSIFKETVEIDPCWPKRDDLSLRPGQLQGQPHPHALVVPRVPPALCSYAGYQDTAGCWELVPGLEEVLTLLVSREMCLSQPGKSK